MYGSYERTHSVFQNSDMMANGKPGAGRAGAAGAVPRQGAGRGVRRAVRAAGVRRLRPGPRAAAPGAAQLLQEAGYADQGRQARHAEGRAHHDRVPDRRADLPAASHALHQESRHARHRRQRCASSIRCSIASASNDFDFDITIQRFGFSIDAGRFAAHLLLLAGGRDSRARRTSPASPIRRSTR